MSTVLAGSPGDHCRQTVQHVGEARGKIEVVAGVETYIASPADGSNKKIILWFSDVYGPLYINSQLMMDFFADNGYLAVGLDYFEGDSAMKHVDEEGFDFDGWVPGKLQRAKELVNPWIDAVKQEFGAEETKYVCVGECADTCMCFESTSLTITGRILLRRIVCYGVSHRRPHETHTGAFAHPAFINEEHCVQSRSCSLEIDKTFPLEARRRAEDILIENKATYFIQVFGSVKHGFACCTGWAKEESAGSILNWFDHFTK